MSKMLVEPCTSKETALILDFSVLLGREVLVCGGELWRVEEILNTVFETYQLTDTSIYLDLHALFVTARQNMDEEPLIRQISIGDISPDLERLTRLNRLVRRICSERTDPKILRGIFDRALTGPEYPDYVIILATVGALLSLDYILGGTWREAILATLGITAFMLIDRFFSSVPGTNHIVLRASAAFVVGLLNSLACQIGFLAEPYLAIIITAFGLLPGIPLINACREIFCGRPLNGISLLSYAFTETLIIVAGFWLALILMGV
jgi:uncharacterized membrane protein YjjP (DUF1212 family)